MAFLFSSVAAGRSQSWLIRAMDGRNHSAVGFWNKGAGPIRRKVPSLSLFFSLSSSSSFLSYVRRGIYAGADCLVRGTLSVISGGWPFLFFLSPSRLATVRPTTSTYCTHTVLSVFGPDSTWSLSLSESWRHDDIGWNTPLSFWLPFFALARLLTIINEAPGRSRVLLLPFFFGLALKTKTGQFLVCI